LFEIGRNQGKDKLMEQQSSGQQDPSTSTETSVGARTWIATIFFIVFLPAIILFGSAGTLDWPMAWLYIVLTVASFAISRLIVWRKNPDLLRERGRSMSHEDTASFDRILAPLLALVGPALIGLVAGFAIRFGWIPVFSPLVKWIGVGFFVLGYVIGSWALVSNRFFSGVVRIQKERGHHVVSTGPYVMVRHPGYLGAGISYFGMVLMLGSPWAFIPLIFELIVVVVRTGLEDKLLQTELPGYTEYAQQTRFRLVPGIW
jgi:protein-S-isoprenylcysteine O-methyltransferase Ste14